MNTHLKSSILHGLILYRRPWTPRSPRRLKKSALAASPVSLSVISGRRSNPRSRRWTSTPVLVLNKRSGPASSPFPHSASSRAPSHLLPPPKPRKSAPTSPPTTSSGTASLASTTHAPPMPPFLRRSAALSSDSPLSGLFLVAFTLFRKWSCCDFC